LDGACRADKVARRSEGNAEDGSPGQPDFECSPVVELRTMPRSWSAFADAVTPNAGRFGDYEAGWAASYWRYNMHLGGATLVFAAYGVARLARQRNFTFAPRSALRTAGAVADAAARARVVGPRG
jgi:hypothetical protein